MSELYFSEIQRFRKWWLWVMMLGINSIFVYGIIQQIFIGRPFGDNPMSDTGLCLSAFFMLILSLLLFNMRLETQLKSDGIYLRFFPFHFKYKFYAWSDIDKAYVRQYNPIKEYGGWGLRIGAFNVSGDKGMQLEFKNGKKLLLGTNQEIKLKEVLSSLGHQQV
jgi:hypothetical protein